jgi:glycosyltransferase involved in cell wall biosynthesis
LIGNATVSIVCGVKNRQEHLAKVLPGWCACPEVDEVVIVDWSSDERLNLCDHKLTMVQVTEQRYWVASKCHNLGLRLARGDLILRLDADDELEPEFFRRHPLGVCDGVYYFVDQRKIRNDNEIHLAGIVYAARNDFLKINGYNERITFYGYEDDDLVNRLREHGVRPVPIDFDTVHHLPHGEDERLGNQLIGSRPELVVKPECVSWTWHQHGIAGKAAQSNEAEAKARPWKATDKMSIFRVVAFPGGYWCEEVAIWGADNVDKSNGFLYV